MHGDRYPLLLQRWVETGVVWKQTVDQHRSQGAVHMSKMDLGPVVVSFFFTIL